MVVSSIRIHIAFAILGAGLGSILTGVVLSFIAPTASCEGPLVCTAAGQSPSWLLALPFELVGAFMCAAALFTLVWTHSRSRRARAAAREDSPASFT